MANPELREVAIIHCDDSPQIIDMVKTLVEYALTVNEQVTITLDSILVSKASDINEISSNVRKKIEIGIPVVVVTDFDMGALTGKDVVEDLSSLPKGQMIIFSSAQNKNGQNVAEIAKNLGVIHMPKGSQKEGFALAAKIDSIIDGLLHPVLAA